MAKLAEFNRYIKKLCQALGHQHRHAGFADYSRGLMLPIARKSVEPLAAHTDPLHVSAKHQSLRHLVAKSEWSDRAVLACVRDWVMPELGRHSQFYWIVDDTWGIGALQSILLKNPLTIWFFSLAVGG